MTSVYLGGLPGTISRQELLGHLSIYGRVTALNIQRGFSFVEYACEADAKDFVNAFEHQPFMGHDMRIELAKKPRRQSTSSTPSPEVGRAQPRANHNDGGRVRYPVVVNNLNPRTCWQELKDFGRMAGGTVAFCDIDRKERRRGFLEYYTQEDASRFVEELDGKELLGNTVSLVCHGRKTLRPEHGPRSRSPTPRDQRQRYTTSLPAYSDRLSSRSRSQSPLSSRRHDYNQSYSHARRPSFRQEDEDEYFRSNSYRISRSPRLSPRHSIINSADENPLTSHEAGKVTDVGSKTDNTSYYPPDDYLYPSYENRTGLDAQWQEYHMPPNAFS